MAFISALTTIPTRSCAVRRACTFRTVRSVRQTPSRVAWKRVQVAVREEDGPNDAAFRRQRAWEALENGASVGQAEPDQLAQACEIVCEVVETPATTTTGLESIVTPERGWRLAFTSGEIEPEVLGSLELQCINAQGTLAVGAVRAATTKPVYLLFVNTKELRFGTRAHEHGSLGYYQGMLTEPVDNAQPVTSEDTVFRSLQLAAIGGTSMAVLLLIFLLSNHLI